MPENQPDIPQSPAKLIEDWAAGLARSVESMTGEAPEIAHEPAPETLSSPEGQLWWRQEFSHAPGEPLWIGCSPESWQEIGSQVLRAAGLENSSPGDLKSTYQEVLNQSFSALAEGFSGRLRKEITCSEAREEMPAMDGSLPAWRVSLSFKVGKALLIAIPSPGLIRGIEPAASPQAQALPDSQSDTAVPATTGAKPLDLLLDVELPVSISFGRTQLPLKDVVKLTTGSIVELNRLVSEPVEVIVNNCVIARGQVVVIEGNFGVRIQQVISRQERLRTLK